MPKSKSSRRWLQRHFADDYVKRARSQGYRSRAAFKLLEIQERDHILGPGMTVLDLGAAPGGWSQVAQRHVGERGRVLALDILPMDPIPGVECIQGDFRQEETLGRLRAALSGSPVALVISDMAPNVSGVGAVDQPRAMYLCELAFDVARELLNPGGCLVVKTFHGEGFDAFFRDLRTCFKRVVSRKPKASRTASREVYLVATSYNL